MRRIKGAKTTFAFQAAGGQTRVSAAFGAMTVDDVEFKRTAEFERTGDGGHVAPADVAAHRRAMKSKGEMNLEGFEACLGQPVAACAVGKDADLVAGGRLRSDRRRGGTGRRPARADSEEYGIGSTSMPACAGDAGTGTLTQRSEASVNQKKRSWM